MKKILIIFFSLIIVLALYFTVTWWSLLDTEKLSVVANLVTLVSSLATLIIALLLFQRFKIDNFILEQQFTVVNELFLEIKKISFLGQSLGGLEHFIQLHFSEPSWHMDQEYSSKFIAVDVSFFKELANIEKLKNNVFMPKNISNVLKKITPSILTPIEKSEEHLFFKLWVRGDTNGEAEAMLLNDKKITLRDFSLLLEEIINTSKAWISENSDSKYNLNI